jgi:hypothetical protein
VATDKESMMLMMHVVRGAMNVLCRPFIQRLSTLIISTMLAMSLISTISVLILPQSEHEVASYMSNQSAPVAHLGVAHIQEFMPKMRMHGQVFAQRAEKHDTERRPA